MDIIDDNEPKYYGEVEIHDTLDVPEDTMNSEDLDNQSTRQLEYAKYSGDSEYEEQDMEETLPPESQGDTESVVEYMYNQLDTDYDYY